MIGLFYIFRNLVCRLLGCVGPKLEEPAKRIETPFNTAFSVADLTKLLDSARSEIRSYQALYLSLFGVSFLAITIILKLPVWDQTTALIRGCLVLPWAVGILLLVSGVRSITPQFDPRSNKADDLGVLTNIDKSLIALEEAKGKRALVEAVRETLRIQANIADAKKPFFLGVLIVVFGIILGVVMSIWSGTTSKDTTHVPNPSHETTGGADGGRK